MLLRSWLPAARPSRHRRRPVVRSVSAEVQRLEERALLTVLVDGGADANLNEGDTLNQNGSFTDDNGAATSWTATVDYGDGSGSQVLALDQVNKTFVLNHQYADDGSYTVTVTITNDQTDSGLDTVGVTVANVAPTATVSGAASVDEGAQYDLTISGLTDPGADTVTDYTISWGDGSADTTISAAALAAANGVVSHTFADGDANVTITVSATDEDGTFQLGTQGVTVNNVAPTATLNGTGSVNEGSQYDVTISNVTDPGADTITSYTISWGDGTADTVVSAAQLAADNGVVSHVFADGPSSPAVTVSATDEDGTFALGTLNPSFVNVAPTATVSGAATVNEGSQYDLTISNVTDPGADTITSYTISWGDGTADTVLTAAQFAAANGLVSHTFADGDANVTITVSATDEDGTFVLGTKNVAVNNVAPTATVGGAASVNEGATYSVTVSNVTDPGADTITGYTISWGDGTADTVVTAAQFAAASGVFTHIYADGGNGGTARTVTVSATDEDGTFVAGTANLTVNNVAPTANAVSLSIGEGDTFSGTVSGTDPAGANDPLTVTAVNGNGASVGQTITLGSGARLRVNADGTYTYDPNGAFRALRAGQTATDSFTFTLGDGDGGTSTATVTVTIHGAGADDLIGYAGGAWYVSKATAGGSSTALWAQWADVAWDALLEADVDGDGRTDVIGLYNGEWYVAKSNGGAFGTAALAAVWSDVNWTHVMAADVNGDGKADVLAEVSGQWWVMTSNGSGFDTASRWAVWADVAWGLITTADVNGDGAADLIGYYGGAWYVGVSSEVVFDGPALWEQWGDANWTGLGTGDFDGDGDADVYGFVGGSWYVGLSNGTSGFTTGLRAQWSGVAWQDAVVGDFDGDGTTDVAARVNGSWYVGLSNGSGGQASLGLWEVWGNVAWKDVRVGDFNGDGKADIAGRYAGVWYVARSTGSAFTTSEFARWVETDWRAVAAADMDGDAPAVSSGGGGALMLAPASPKADEGLDLFWAQSDKDDEFLSALLAA